MLLRQYMPFQNACYNMMRLSSGWHLAVLMLPVLLAMCAAQNLSCSASVVDTINSVNSTYRFYVDNNQLDFGISTLPTTIVQKALQASEAQYLLRYNRDNPNYADAISSTKLFQISKHYSSVLITADVLREYNVYACPSNYGGGTCQWTVPVACTHTAAFDKQQRSVHGINRNMTCTAVLMEHITEAGNPLSTVRQSTDEAWNVGERVNYTASLTPGAIYTNPTTTYGNPQEAATAVGTYEGATVSLTVAPLFQPCPFTQPWLYKPRAGQNLGLGAYSCTPNSKGTLTFGLLLRNWWMDIQPCIGLNVAFVITQSLNVPRSMLLIATTPAVRRRSGEYWRLVHDVVTTNLSDDPGLGDNINPVGATALFTMGACTYNCTLADSSVSADACDAICFAVITYFAGKTDYAAVDRSTGCAVPVLALLQSTDKNWTAIQTPMTSITPACGVILGSYTAYQETIPYPAPITEPSASGEAALSQSLQIFVPPATAPITLDTDGLFCPSSGVADRGPRGENLSEFRVFWGQMVPQGAYSGSICAQTDLRYTPDNVQAATIIINQIIDAAVTAESPPFRDGELPYIILQRWLQALQNVIIGLTFAATAMALGSHINRTDSIQATLRGAVADARCFCFIHNHADSVAKWGGAAVVLLIVIINNISALTITISLIVRYSAPYTRRTLLTRATNAEVVVFMVEEVATLTTRAAVWPGYLILVPHVIILLAMTCWYVRAVAKTEVGSRLQWMEYTSYNQWLAAQAPSASDSEHAEVQKLA